jgi:hypothetical protein
MMMTTMINDDCGGGGSEICIATLEATDVTYT